MRTLKAISSECEPQDTDFLREIIRSRQEDRTVDVFPVGNGLARTDWRDLVVTIIRVTRRTLCFDAATGQWNPRSEISFYASSHAVLTASQWQHVIRGHWGIENRNHYVRDVSCDEDKSRIRVNPGIMARTRSFNLNLLRHNHITNVKNALWEGALCLERVLSYAGL